MTFILIRICSNYGHLKIGQFHNNVGHAMRLQSNNLTIDYVLYLDLPLATGFVMKKVPWDLDSWKIKKNEAMKYVVA